MKKFFKRVLAVGLVASMMLTSLTACSGTSGREKIDSDTPWFNVSKLAIGSDIDTSLFDSVSTKLVGITDTELIYDVSGVLRLPDDFDWETDNFSDYSYDEVVVYDYEGNKLGSIDIITACKNAGLGDLFNLNGVSRVGDDYVVEVTSYSEDWSSKTYYQAVLDVENISLMPFEEVTTSDLEDEISSREEGSFELTRTINGYTIKPFWVSGDRYSYILVLTDAEGNSTSFDFRELFSTVIFYSISNIIDIGNGRGLIFAGTDSGDAYYILDTNTSTVTLCTEDMSWLAIYTYNIQYVDGFGSVVVNQEGVSSIDFDNHTLVSMLNFNNTNVNRFDVNEATPVYISDDRVILEGSNYSPSLDTSSNLSALYIFERADSNPNVGKSILKIASLGSYNYSICDSMCRFNETNPDYFLQIDTRYVLSKFYDASNSDSTSATEQAQQDLGNQLSVDLISGDGPDIIIDGANFSQLNNSDYLLDLSDYVSGLDSSSYFTNIIDVARTNEQIFQLPLTYAVQGIVTDASNVAPGQIGFTYDEYAQFVDTVCNGVDPIKVNSQTDFFVQALAFMPDLMVEDGSVNFNNEAFLALADYTRDHVNNAIEGDDGSIAPNEAAQGQTLASMLSYINSIIGPINTRVLMGPPTYDGRGPVVIGVNSVGVVANLSSNETNACLDYVSLLLDDTTQYQLGIEAGIPINRNVFVQLGEDIVDKHNSDFIHWYGNMTEAEIRENGINPDPVDYSSVEAFENLISTANTWVTTDGAINAIIREEIPAYFEGQKTLDQIIEVLENRIHTLVNERG